MNDVSTYEPMLDTKWEIKFTDEPLSPVEESERTVHQWMRNWINIMRNNKKKEIDIEEKYIDDVIAADDFSAYLDNEKTGEQGKLYSTGVKRNGKVDLAMVFKDKTTILKDCELTTVNDSSNFDINLNIEYDSIKKS